MNDQIPISLRVRSSTLLSFAVKLIRRHSDNSFYVYCGSVGRSHVVYPMDYVSEMHQLPKGGEILNSDGFDWAREVETSAALAIYNLVYNSPIMLHPVTTTVIPPSSTDYDLAFRYYHATSNSNHTPLVEFNWWAAPPDGWFHLAEVAERMIEWAEPEVVLAPFMEGTRRLPRFGPEVPEKK